MAQQPDLNSPVEMEEIDQANNVVATYIHSSIGEKDSRIDVVVSDVS